MVCRILDDIGIINEWNVLNDEAVETICVTCRPKILLRQVSNLTIGMLYHPPKAADGPIIAHIHQSLDHILQKHPQTGIKILGDMNQLKRSATASSYKLKQIVKKPTCGKSMLDKVLINLNDYCKEPDVIPSLGESVHANHIVSCHPKPGLNVKAAAIITKTVRINNHTSRTFLVHELNNIDWTPLYRHPLVRNSLSI